MVEAISGNSQVNFTEGVKRGASDLAKKVSNLFTSTMKWMSFVGHNIECRKSLHKLILGACTLGTALGRGASTIPLVALTINSVDSVIDLFDFSGSFSFFCVKQNPKRNRLVEKTMENGENKVYRKEQPVERGGKTMLEYHKAKGKYLSMAAAVVGTGALFFSVVSFLDNMKLIHLGKTLSPLAGVASLVGTTIYFGLKAAESAKYLYEAYNGDKMKDKTKGWLELATRVSLTVLFGAMLLGATQTGIMVPLYFGSGIFGLAYGIYGARRLDQKSELNDELLKKVQNRQEVAV